jgi:DUF3011 family protein
LLLAALAAAPASAASLQAEPQETPRVRVRQAVVSCSADLGERQYCPADTSKGVALGRSKGDAACLLGRTWGYDDKGVWVSDGCSADFVVGSELEKVVGQAEPEPERKAPAYIPNAGFLIVHGDKGEMYIRLMTYVRYLNQKGLDPTYVDAFGNTKTVAQRQDVQLNKFFLPFSGWFLSPKFRYYLYVWSSNPSQGDPAQVVGAGNLSYIVNRYVTIGGGISALPSVRSTEGQFPYWLGVDDRLTSDEFFRGSYTSGLWLKGELSTKFKYMAMIGNNLSTLGVSAAQLDNTFNTTALMIQWLPTTGEFGLYGAFGDFDHHEKLATRLGAHYTHSREDKQSQPGSNSIENSQIRLTDGSTIFTPDLFGPGITVEKVTYDMVAVDGGIKKKGFALEAEYYWRFLGDYAGPNTAGLDDIDDHGFQVQASAMPVPKTLQVYLGGAAIRGVYGNSSEVRAGANFFPMKERGLRLNGEWLHLNKVPVGYTAVPYPVGGNGDVLHLNFELNF